jgi:Tol biopolymer transport system component
MLLIRPFALSAVLLGVGGLFLLAESAIAQDGPSGPGLFVALEIPGWQDPAADDDSIIRSRPVIVDFQVLAGIDPEAIDLALPLLVQFNLFDDASVAVVLDHARPRWASAGLDCPPQLIGYVWHGWTVGDDAGYAVMVTGPGLCYATVYFGGNNRYQVRPEGDIHVVREYDGTAPFVCGTESTGPVLPLAGPTGGTTCDDGSRVDVIVLYTADAMVEAGGAPRIEAVIDEMIEEANLEIYPNSEIFTELRLLHKGLVEYVEGSGTPDDHKAALADPWDGELDEVQPLRDAMRADLVSLITVTTGLGATAFLMDTESPAFESRGFCVLDYESLVAANNFTLVHEFGHNMGCGHHRRSVGCEDDCDCASGAFDFSFGHTLTFEEIEYRTVMSTFSEFFSLRIPYFSNPNVTYPPGPDGVPTGIPEGDCNSADNAKTIELTKDTVAQFRTSNDTTDTTRMASRDYLGVQGNGSSLTAAISGSGQFIAFASYATNLAVPDVNGASDIFLYNRESGVIELVSRQLDDIGNSASFDPAVSGNGRFVAFSSDATNLIAPLSGEPPDMNDARDIFVREHRAVTTTRVSLTHGGGEANGNSFSPAISASGRFVAFASEATNLVGADGNLTTDIFVRDRDLSGDGSFDEAADTSTTLVSYSFFDGAEANGPSFAPAICADGQYVAFGSEATNLLGGGNDGNVFQDVFLYDATAGPGERITRVSVEYTSGGAPSGDSYAPSISADGDWIAFHSDAPDLAPEDTNVYTDVFVYDRTTSQTILVSVNPGGVSGDGDSLSPCISANGRFVAFESQATDLLAGPDPGLGPVRGVFVYDLDTGDMVRISNPLGGVQANGPSRFPAASGDGRFVAFRSQATNLVAEDQNGSTSDIFFRDRGVMCPGDLNGDGVVDGTDYGILMRSWGECACCASDLNGDGMVGMSDKGILLLNLGECP